MCALTSVLMASYCDRYTQKEDWSKALEGFEKAVALNRQHAKESKLDEKYGLLCFCVCTYTYADNMKLLKEVIFSDSFRHFC